MNDPQNPPDVPHWVEGSDATPPPGALDPFNMRRFKCIKCRDTGAYGLCNEWLCDCGAVFTGVRHDIYGFDLPIKGGQGRSAYSLILSSANIALTLAFCILSATVILLIAKGCAEPRADVPTGAQNQQAPEKPR